jgi:hypothetical protein
VHKYIEMLYYLVLQNTKNKSRSNFILIWDGFLNLIGLSTFVCSALNKKSITIDPKSIETAKLQGYLKSSVGPRPIALRVRWMQRKCQCFSV